MRHTHTPLLSIVIPTHNRPQFLPRAVESALACQRMDTEIIVVPNGSDESWKRSLAPWENDARICVSPIGIAHANVARNHGMDLATGKYIRFLDDDDYLLPRAEQQLEVMECNNAEICSGRLISRDQDNTDLGLVSFPDTEDFVVAATTLSGFTATTGNIFLRKALYGCRWDARVNRAQDYAWILDLARSRDLRWTRFEEPVVVWFQHHHTRTSSTRRFTGRENAIIRRLLTLPRQLEKQNRQSPERTSAIAQALWFYIHRGFPNHPCYWSNVAHAALKLDDAARPSHPLFRHKLIRSMNPLWIERLLFPVRTLSQLAKGALEATGYQNRRRNL